MPCGNALNLFHAATKLVLKRHGLWNGRARAKDVTPPIMDEIRKEVSI